MLLWRKTCKLMDFLKTGIFSVLLEKVSFFFYLSIYYMFSKGIVFHMFAEGLCVFTLRCFYSKLLYFQNSTPKQRQKTLQYFYILNAVAISDNFRCSSNPSNNGTATLKEDPKGRTDVLLRHVLSKCFPLSKAKPYLCILCAMLIDGVEGSQANLLLVAPGVPLGTSSSSSDCWLPWQ